MHNIHDACVLNYGNQHHNHNVVHTNSSKSHHTIVNYKCSKEYQQCYNAMKALFHHNPESWKVLWDISSPEPSRREECFQNCRRLLMSWFRGFGSPKDLEMLRNPEDLHDFSHWGDTSMFYLINEQTPDLLRLKYSAPLSDVRLWCTEILKELENLGVPIPRPLFDSPSCFIPKSEFQYLHDYYHDTNSSLNILYREHFYKYNRVENYLMVMGFHAEYLESYLKCLYYLMNKDGPIPYDERHYICIMAAASHRCTELMRLHTIQYLLKGGDVAWLDNPSRAPLRLQNLKEINFLLAHQPWLLTSEHMKFVTPSEISSDRGAYSLSELMHAITLLCHTHALCSFIFASGVNPEIDSPMGHFSTLTSASTVNAQQQCWKYKHNCCTTSDDEETLCNSFGTCVDEKWNGDEDEEFDTTDLEQTNDSLQYCSSKTDDKLAEDLSIFLQTIQHVSMLDSEAISEEEMLQRFYALQQENRAVFNSLFTCDKEEQNLIASSPNSKNFHSISTTISLLDVPSSPSHRLDPFVEKFLTQPEVACVCPEIPECCSGAVKNGNDEKPASTKNHFTGIFQVSDFNWEDDGVTMVENCLPDLGSLINERFLNIYELTYCSVGNAYNVNTNCLRSAIWKYVHSLYLILHDNYNYSGMEQLLSYDMRCFIQRIAMVPHTVNHFHFIAKWLRIFTPAERIHLILMVMEARMQASLLYALHAIKRSITS